MRVIIKKSIFCLMAIISLLGNISCEEEEEPKSGRVVSIFTVHGEWTCGEDYMIFSNDGTFVMYFKNRGILQAGTYKFDDMSKTIHATNMFDNTATDINVRYEGYKVIFKINCFNRRFYSQASFEVGDSDGWIREKNEASGCFKYYFMNTEWPMYSEAIPKLGGHESKLYRYTLKFKNQYQGTFTDRTTYGGNTANDVFDGFDFYYVWRNNKLYFIPFTSEITNWMSQYIHILDYWGVMNVPFVIDEKGHVHSWECNEMAKFINN